MSVEIYDVLNHEEPGMFPETKKLFETVKQHLDEPSQDEVPYFETLKMRSEDEECTHYILP